MKFEAETLLSYAAKWQKILLRDHQKVENLKIISAKWCHFVKFSKDILHFQPTSKVSCLEG